MKTLKWFLAAICILIIVVIGCSELKAQTPRQLYEESGGFSYNPPEGWQIVELPDYKYRVSHGPLVNEFVPGIEVVDEICIGSLSACVDGTVEIMRKAFKKFDILKREAFETEDGESGFKLITELVPQSRLLRQTFYFFGKSRRKYVAICSTLAEGGAKLDPIFEKSIRTFRIH
jgi:hypothetical protein